MPFPIAERSFNLRRRIPTQKRSQKTRQAILDAALRLAEAQGVENLSMQGIAAEAKLAAGTAYHYFDDLDAICLEIYLERAEIWWSALMEATSIRLDAQHYEQQVRLLVETMALFHHEHYVKRREAFSILRYVDTTKSGGEVMQAVLNANTVRWVEWAGPLLKSVGYSSSDVEQLCVTAMRTIRSYWAHGDFHEDQWEDQVRSAADGVVSLLKMKLREASHPRREASSSGASALFAAKKSP